MLPGLAGGVFLALPHGLKFLVENQHAYPFMSFAFVLVLVLSSVFLHEAVTIPKIVGIALIAAGVIIGSWG